MSENEIVKHVEAAYKALQNPQTRWVHKLTEVLIEIGIIVFAVSLSIWFHNWSDSLHEHKEEREYLAGLKQDIGYDLVSARNDSAFYANKLVCLSYFRRVGLGTPLDRDSMRSYQELFFSTATLDPQVSRYEGLKSSGKLGIIENTDLLNNIIALHEQTIKHVNYLDGFYADYSARLGNFVQEHGVLARDKDSLTNPQDILRLSQMRLLMNFGAAVINSNIIKAHDTCIAQCRHLIAQIDRELDGRSPPH